ncbi:MAG: aminoglycoside phosphotransferase [Desulfobacteraceae bacterium]|nr:MAG: aminoglycoside phosphotransferase [Desulfobacteraceae bacterium]
MKIDNSIINAAAEWNLTVTNIHRNIPIAGSPERCELRFVIECNNNRLYLIESVFDTDVYHKLNIISCLNYLSGRSLSSVNPYICNNKKEYIVDYDERFWQLSPFVDGVALDRPEYVFDKWRGGVFADFLIDLGNKSKGIPLFNGTAPFSIPDYIYKLISQIRENDPEVLGKIEPVISFLEKRFIKVHDMLPVAFCHGDFHPLNIIWSEDSIKAVIDWEFMGIKPRIYDAANLIGCIGVEDPEGLTGELACDFIAALKEAGLISGISREVFIEFVVAVRFAWLSEWLRHKDREMIELETTFMNLLADNYGMLKNTWKL